MSNIQPGPFDPSQIFPSDQHVIVDNTSSNPVLTEVTRSNVATPDSGNSATRTSSDGATQFVGAWYDTRNPNDSTKWIVAAQQLIFNSTVTSGLGGTFIFQWSTAGSDATITVNETRVITDFATVRDLTLQNVGNYFRVKFTPSRALTGGELLFIVTSQWFITPPPFVRLANQQIEIANAGMPQAFAYVKGFGPDGKSRNVGVTPDDRLQVDTDADYTMFGSLVTSNLHDYISVIFDNDNDMATQTVSLATSTGSETTTLNNLVISTGAGTTAVTGRKSKARLIYTPGHEARAQFTTIYSASTPGATQIHGLLTDAGNDGAYFEDDGTGFFIVHKRNGTEVSKIAQANWNGNLLTDYTENGVVIPFVPTTNGRVYQIKFGYLGYLGIEYWVFSPDGKPVLAHKVRYQDTTPLFADLNLHLVMQIAKTSGSSNVTMKSGSWQGGVFGEPLDPLISAVNSTTTALGAGGVFTGDWVAHGANNSLELVINTNVVSAGNGIQIQFSDRGNAAAAVVRTQRLDTFNAADVVNGFKSIVVEPRLSFTRVIYTNGGTAQGNFFMELRFHKQLLEIPRGELESSVSSTNVAVMGRDVIMAANDSAVYGNVTRGTSGGLRTSVNQFEAEAPIKSLAGLQVTRTNMTTTAGKVVATPMTNRRAISIKAICSGSALVYIGTSNAVTAGNGYPLSDGQSIDLDVDDTVTEIWGIASTGTQAVSVIEISL